MPRSTRIDGSTKKSRKHSARQRDASARVVATGQLTRDNSSRPDEACPDVAILQRWLAATTGFSEVLKRLTPGQCQVLRTFLADPSDRVVARQLGLRESTV